MSKLINVTQLAEMLNVSEKTIYDWVHRRFIPHAKLGRLVRFDPEEIGKWIEARRVSGSTHRRLYGG